ncbi:hypothetical protein GGR56DRAFT_164555 [Xylariaceae sp. FL0804]|nr:hypothetical protein GGR56DRAFT_164555 [Xylariaceae sp. FL0804]
MVGVPKSNRCTFCKSRKTKCDEQWPTCGTCARAGKICSGARSSFKFIVNGCHNETTATELESDGTGNNLDSLSLSTAGWRQHSPDTAMIDVRQSVKSGCTFGRMRLRRPNTRPRAPSRSPVPSLSPVPTLSPSPSPGPSTADQLAAKLISCLDAAPMTGNDLHILGAFLRMLPSQLGTGSSALLHSVELVISSWTNSRKGLPASVWLDLRVYNKALRSLTGAIGNPNHEPVWGTLTALCLLQKVEILYDFGRGSNRENHAAGLIAVISKGGHRRTFTDIELHLIFEGFFHMLQEDIRLGRVSAFATPEWQTALKQAIEASNIQSSLKQMYWMWVEMTIWPTLAKLVRTLCHDPSDTMTAAEIVLRAMPLIEYLLREDDTTLKALKDAGDILEVSNPMRPDLFPTSYEFCDFPTAKLYCFHAMFGIIVYRTLQQANRILGHDVPYLSDRCRDLSRRVWMAHPWMRNKLPLSVDFTAALAFSYESATYEEREFCTEALSDMESFRRPPPVGNWMEATILANAKGYTGRLPFIKTQDVSVEYSGIGCRS